MAKESITSAADVVRDIRAWLADAPLLPAEVREQLEEMCEVLEAHGADVQADPRKAR